jgi:hypothetical protein
MLVDGLLQRERFKETTNGALEQAAHSENGKRK